MIRKMAICAVVALIPGFAFAADAVTNSAAPAAPAAVAPDKGNVTAKTDTTAKTDVTKKAVHHRGAHKTGDDKAGSTAAVK